MMAGMEDGRENLNSGVKISDVQKLERQVKGVGTTAQKAEAKQLRADIARALRKDNQSGAASLYRELQALYSEVTGEVIEESDQTDGNENVVPFPTADTTDAESTPATITPGANDSIPTAEVSRSAAEQNEGPKANESVEITLTDIREISERSLPDDIESILEFGSGKDEIRSVRQDRALKQRTRFRGTQERIKRQLAAFQETGDPKKAEQLTDNYHRAVLLYSEIMKTYDIFKAEVEGRELEVSPVENLGSVSTKQETSDGGIEVPPGGVMDVDVEIEDLDSVEDRIDKSDSENAEDIGGEELRFETDDSAEGRERAQKALEELETENAAKNGGGGGGGVTNNYTINTQGGDIVGASIGDGTVTNQGSVSGRSTTTGAPAGPDVAPTPGDGGEGDPGTDGPEGVEDGPGSLESVRNGLQIEVEEGREWIENNTVAMIERINLHQSLSPAQKLRAIVVLQSDKADYLDRLNMVTPEEMIAHYNAVKDVEPYRNRRDIPADQIVKLSPGEQSPTVRVKEAFGQHLRQTEDDFAALETKLEAARANGETKIEDRDLAATLGFIDNGRLDPDAYADQAFEDISAEFMTGFEAADTPEVPDSPEYAEARKEFIEAKRVMIEAEKDFLKSQDEMRELNMQTDGLMPKQLWNKFRKRKDRAALEQLETDYLDSEVAYQETLARVLNARQAREVTHRENQGASEEDIAAYKEKSGTEYYKATMLARAFAVEGDAGYRTETIGENKKTLQEISPGRAAAARSTLEKRLDYKLAAMNPNKKYLFEVVDGKLLKPNVAGRMWQRSGKATRFLVGAGVAGAAAAFLVSNPARVLVSAVLGGAARRYMDNNWDPKKAEQFESAIQAAEQQYKESRSEAVSDMETAFADLQNQVINDHAAIEKQKRQNEFDGWMHTGKKTFVTALVGGGSGLSMETGLNMMGVNTAGLLPGTWPSWLTNFLNGGNTPSGAGTPGSTMPTGAGGGPGSPSAMPTGATSAPTGGTPGAGTPSAGGATSMPGTPTMPSGAAVVETGVHPATVECLPTKEPTVAEMKVNFDTPTTYVVEKGDTIWDMAEGQTNLDQPAAFAAVPADKLQYAIDLVVDRLALDSHAQEVMGIRDASRNPNLWLFTGEPFNPDAFNKYATEVLVDAGIIDAPAAPEPAPVSVPTPEVTPTPEPTSAPVEAAPLEPRPLPDAAIDTPIDTPEPAPEVVPEAPTLEPRPLPDAAKIDGSEVAVDAANPVELAPGEVPEEISELAPGEVLRPAGRESGAFEAFVRSLDTAAEKKSLVYEYASKNSVVALSETAQAVYAALGIENVERSVRFNNEMVIQAVPGESLTNLAQFDPRLADSANIAEVRLDGRGNLISAITEAGTQVSFELVDGVRIETLREILGPATMAMIESEVASRTDGSLANINELYATITERELLTTAFDKELELNSLDPGLAGLYEISYTEIKDAIGDNTLEDLIKENVVTTNNQPAIEGYTNLITALFTAPHRTAVPLDTFKDFSEVILTERNTSSYNAVQYLLGRRRTLNVG